MQAIILAGGKGTRLRPYTTVLPKPLMPVGECPILEIVIRQLKENGFRDITISTGHLAELIMAYFGDGRRFGVSIKYLYENIPLSTAGALKLIKNPSENFLVMNGDILCDVKYKELFRKHLKEESVVTICVKKQTVKVDYGVLKFDKGFELNEYIEKPEFDIHVSTGIYVMNKKVLAKIKNNEVLSMPDLINRLLSDKEKIQCVIHKGLWLDIGRHEDYQKANEIISVINDGSKKIRNKL